MARGGPRWWTRLLVIACTTLAVGTMRVPAASAAPLDDPFFQYSGSLDGVPPGTVLKTRTIPVSLLGIPTPLTAVQLLYRTKNQAGRAVTNVTTVIKPPPTAALLPSPRVLSYQSFYDSLDPADQPSAALAGGVGLGEGIAQVEVPIITPFLLAGYTVNIPDTEGQEAEFAAGPAYGVNTVDSLRAISQSADTGVGASSPIGLFGYSGGAIGSEWAAEKVTTYAPEIASRIVGTAIGGILVHPGHNLHYIDGSQVWAGVLAMALVGISRAFDIDLTPYASDYGKELLKKLDKASIGEVLFQYPGLTWAKLTKPEYNIPESVPVYVEAANRLIMGATGTPSAPMFMGQGTGGDAEGTSGSTPGIGPGDGVMIAGDVRSLAREYCQRGLDIQYNEYATSHFTSIAQFQAEATPWILARFNGTAAPNNCASIRPGNSLAPIVGIGGASGKCYGRQATIVGTPGNDTLIGTSKADVIVGLGGDDVIYGGGGRDRICGGSGNDRLSGGKANDKLFGSTGNDRVLGGSGNDRVSGGKGNDRVVGGPGKDRVLGGSGKNKRSP